MIERNAYFAALRREKDRLNAALRPLGYEIVSLRTGSVGTEQWVEGIPIQATLRELSDAEDGHDGI